MGRSWQEEEVPPHLKQTEQALLACLMLAEGEEFSAMLPQVNPDLFYLAPHRSILKGIISVNSGDLSVLSDHFTAEGKVSEIGGISYLSELMLSTHSAKNAPHYIRVLREATQKRMIHEIGLRAVDESSNGTPPADLASKLIERLQTIVAENSPEERNISMLSGKELSEDPTEETKIKWIPIIRDTGIISYGLSVVLSSHPKGGKSTTICVGCASLLRKAPFFRIAWITEEPRQVWRRRLEKHPELKNENFVLIFPDGNKWSTLLSKLESIEAELIIVDTVANICQIADMNDAPTVHAALWPLIGMIRRKNAGLFLLHHLRKSQADSGQGHSGSNVLLAMVDVGIEMHKDNNFKTRRIFKAVSRFEETPSEWVLEMGEDGLSDLGDPEALGLVNVTFKVEEVLSSTPMKREELAALIDPKPSTGSMHRALNILTDEGRAIRTGKGSKGDPHRWSRPLGMAS